MANTGNGYGIHGLNGYNNSMQHEIWTYDHEKKGADRKWDIPCKMVTVYISFEDEWLSYVVCRISN
jgi:hypothetical protein